jgi:hypothetical protein
LLQALLGCYFRSTVKPCWKARNSLAVAHQMKLGMGLGERWNSCGVAILTRKRTMIVEASEEFMRRVKAMSDEELLAAYRERCDQYDALEAERVQCWNRMMEIHKIQDGTGGEMQAMGIAIRFVRKLDGRRKT